MGKIKILRIITRLNVGGPAQNVLYLTDGLDRDTFETILVTGCIGQAEEDMGYIAEAKGIKPLIISQLRRNINPLNDLVAFLRLFHLISKEKPDIIHTHTAKAGALGRVAGIVYAVEMRLLRPFGARDDAVKLIHTFHGHILEGYFGLVKTRLFILIEQFLASFTDRIVAVSEAVRQDLLKFRIGTENKIIVIPLGLELEHFLTQNPEPRTQNQNGYFKIGIVGRLVPVKNHKMFLDVAKLLTTHHLPLTTKFVIVGDGESRTNLEDYAEGLGIKDIVEFKGWQRDMEDMYRDLDIVCLTSLNEGTPVSLIEAMACSISVVATDVGGVRDIVKDGVSGILVQSQDTAGFADALKRLIEDEGLRIRMGTAGREFIKDRFTKERLVKDTEGLYKELLNL